MKTYRLVSLVLIFLSFSLGFYLHPLMPNQMVAHWDEQGKPDGFLQKELALFIIPLLMLGIFELFDLVPRIDPLRHNVKKFGKYYYNFVSMFMTFLFYLYVIMLLANLRPLNIIYFIMPAISFIFFYCGFIMRRTYRNFFIGIRTPWTLSSDRVWKKTHDAGGLLFEAYAVLVLVSLLFIEHAFAIVITGIVALIVFLFAYSYWLWTREGRPRKTIPASAVLVKKKKRKSRKR